MPHYGTLHDFAFQNDVDDIRGTELYGRDKEKLGKIDDVIFDHGTGDIKYAVVDTGGWFKHKKFLVPSDRIQSDGQDSDAFHVDVTKNEIENKFPRYDESELRSEEDWKADEDRFKQFWADHTVQHQAGRVDLDVTPSDVVEPVSERPKGVPMGSLGEEVPPEYDRLAQESASREVEEDIANRDLTPHRLAGKFPEVMQDSQKLHMRPEVAEDRDLDQAKVGSSRVPDEIWEDNATGDSYRERVPGEDLRHQELRQADVGQWHPRMKRFEDVLRKNRVDVTASCASCAPAKDRAA